MVRSKLLSVAVATGLGLAGSATAEDSTTGPFGFTPIDGSAFATEWTADSPWKIPAGFSQSVVSDETDLDIYDGGRDDWHDMNTVNETGKRAGRYMYRTHEVRGQAEGGAVSIVDLQTGETSVFAQDTSWDALDGIEWTPWGTVLFAEETTGGRMFEIVFEDNDPTTGTVFDRPAVGRLAHEGIVADEDGSVYVVDEFRGELAGFGGGIYRFVPDTFGDLSSGALYALAVDGANGTGQGSWVGPIDPADARQSGTDFGGRGYNRPEDLELIGGVLYAAITEGPRNGGSSQAFDGRVIAIDLETLQVTNFVLPGLNVPVEINRPGDNVFQTGFDNPDNLGQTPDGKLMIVEDNVPSDIWVAGKDHDGDGAADAVWHFASLRDYGAEGTGIYFGKDPKTLFVNIQHSKETDGDGTWAITRD
jgi:secreted PhoX family phosphatase